MNTDWGKGSIKLAEQQKAEVERLLYPKVVDLAQVSRVLPVQAVHLKFQEQQNVSGSKQIPKDAAALAPQQRKTGGIDLNFHPQYIERFARGRNSEKREFTRLLPAGFKGFNFNIIRFRPNLTVKGAFNLMLGVG